MTSVTGRAWFALMGHEAYDGSERANERVSERCFLFLFWLCQSRGELGPIWSSSTLVEGLSSWIGLGCRFFPSTVNIFRF